MTGAERTQEDAAVSLVVDGLADRLLRETDGFEKPYCLSGGCDPVAFATHVRRALLRLCTDDTADRDRSLRLWVAQSGDDAFEQRLFANPPAPAEELADWAARVFGDRQWGLTLNGAERWTPELVEALVPVLAPLSYRMPPPSARYELVLFAGNYARTPFGFHRDPVNLRSVHFHIGPGSKTFYVDLTICAEPERFKSMDTIAAECPQFEIAPGDVFFIPAHRHHLGTSDGLGVAVALAIRREFKATLMQAALSAASAEWLDAFPPPADPSDFWLDEGASVDFTGLPDGEVPLRDHAKQALSEYAMRQRSNAGFTKPPLTLSNAPPATRLLLKPSFPIYVRRGSDKIRLFLRGTSLDLVDDNDLWNWLAQTQDHSPVSIETERQLVLAELMLSRHAADPI